VAQASALDFSGCPICRACDRWGLLGAARITSRVAALPGQHAPLVLFLYVRAVATLPASCYFPARCSDMDKRADARSRRVDDAASSSRPAIMRVHTERTKRACTEVAAASRRGVAVERPRAQGRLGARACKLLDTPCRVNFELTYSKQRIGVITKCHTFRTSWLPVSSALRLGGQAWDIKGSQCRRRVEPGRSVVARVRDSGGGNSCAQK